MKIEVKKILNELKTSDGIEVLKLGWSEVVDYREKGYYVLTDIDIDTGMHIGKELCYLSKDEEKLKKKKNNMKDSSKWNIFSKLTKR
jgi:hypothetical protein